MPAATPDDALDHLHELMHQYRSHMHGLTRDDDNGLGPMEARALGFFARHPDATATELVQHSRRDKAQITRLVKLLLERGLLEVVPDPADRRSKRLRLTEAGRAVQRKMQQHRKRLAEQLVAGFSERELTQLLGLMKRLRENFKPAGEEG
ncbi:MAG TPA: MarR family transcriptional regulator [Ideonella sp.]|nr:MarR family transcriptional regulator [Ideonella sp.]